jgi:hypothetical protein
MNEENIQSETRWFRVRRSRNSVQYESKFLTGEASISLKELEAEWLIWSPNEKLEFVRAFSVKPKLSLDDERITRILLQDSDERVLSVCASLAARHSDKAFAVDFLARELLRNSTEPRANFIQRLRELGGTKPIAALQEFYERCREKIEKEPTPADQLLVLDLLDCCEALAYLKRDKSYLEDVAVFSTSEDPTVAAVASEILAGGPPPLNP